MDKQRLLVAGIERAQEFCDKNNLHCPDVRIHKDSWPFKACAYYRPVYIAIRPESCSHLGTTGRSWSWPGYVVDRTPYGVIAHELGHHVDYFRSKERGTYFGDFSKKLRALTKEAPITSYCPNDAEWFAEIFRLYVTNAALLQKIRPKTWSELRKYFEPVSREHWDMELDHFVMAPVRTHEAAHNKILKARK